MAVTSYCLDPDPPSGRGPQTPTGPLARIVVRTPTRLFFVAWPDPHQLFQINGGITHSPVLLSLGTKGGITRSVVFRISPHNTVPSHLPTSPVFVRAISANPFNFDSRCPSSLRPIPSGSPSKAPAPRRRSSSSRCKGGSSTACGGWRAACCPPSGRPHASPASPGRPRSCGPAGCGNHQPRH